MDEWLQRVRQSQQQRTGDGRELAELLSPHFNDTLARLQHALNATPHLRPASYVQHCRSFFPQYSSFADFVASFLLYVRDADSNADDAASLQTAYQLMEDCYRQADKVFAQGDTGWFVPTLRGLTRQLIDLSLRASRAAGDTKLTKAGEAARILGRPMGIAASDRGTLSSDGPSKRDALFFLANATFKVYFAMRNLRLCDTILNNTQHHAAHSLNSSGAYPRSDRVAFSYYRGRLFLYQRRLPQARNELKVAFGLCAAESWSNGRLILIYLITASLPLGFFPALELLQEFDLDDHYAHLISALKVGNYVAVLSELDRHQAWHRSKGNYLLLREKLEVICWRNLARKTLFITTNAQPLPATGAPPTLSLHALLTAAKIAFGTESLDLDDVEGMCASLMEQGYLKAYIMHSKRLVVLQKTQQAGFPPLSGVHPLGPG